MQLTVVMPVFNGAATLTRAVESIRTSTLFLAGQVSVVIVDDGSTDETAEIATGLARDRGHIRLLLAPHAGVSAALNLGIDSTNTKFLTVVAADDYVAPDFHERLLAPLVEHEQCDLVIGGFRRVIADSEFEVKVAAAIVSRDLVGHQIVPLAQQGVLNSVCNKIYRTDVIRKHGVTFEVGREIAEDLLFNLDYLARGSAIHLVDATGYYYVRNVASVTNVRRLRYDPQLELQSNFEFRTLVASKLDVIGVTADSIAAYFRNLDDVWFRTLVKNLSASGTPHTHREQIRRIKTIMRQQPQRANIMSGVSSSNLARLNRLLYRVNSATLAAATYRRL